MPVAYRGLCIRRRRQPAGGDVTQVVKKKLLALLDFDCVTTAQLCDVGNVV